MTTNAIAKRLDVLEAEQQRQYDAYLERLTDAELDALIATLPPDAAYDAAVDVLTDAELDCAIAGQLTHDDVLRLAQGRQVPHA